MTLKKSRLYCILDLGYTPESRAEEATASLLAGGADILQLRAKNHDLATIERVARKLLPLCRTAGIPFILNDFPELAAAIGADGVHIGQDDGSLAQALEKGGTHLACRLLPSSIPHPRPFLIGRSTHSLDQARAALVEGFDYIGFGPLFPTPTKAGRPAIGLQDVAIMQHEVGQHLPAFCIGGITPATLPQVLAAGAHRVVVVSALLQAADIQAATGSLRQSLEAPLH
jgi:thiamine-phosphate pyrophosphorylase